MRIAMIGSRGIPASYSGFETAVENLSVRLAARGHRVTVYCRSTHVTYPHAEYQGVRLIMLPTIPSKHLDTLVHTFLSALHVLCSPYDLVYVCGVGNSLVAWIPRLSGKKVVLNVDGADWERQKWGRFARWFLRTSERWAGRAANVILADSRKVQDTYRDRYRSESTFIPYGADMPDAAGTQTLDRFGVKPKGYILFVGRLVPENGAHELIAAYRGLATDKRLVIVGDAPYAANYIQDLKAQAPSGVVFTGYVFGQGYQELSAHAYLFVLASGVGGTHPVLVEQMAAGNAVLVNGIATNRETIGDAGAAYDPAGGAEALRRELAALLADPERVRGLGAAARRRARDHYSWEAVTDAYESLFAGLTSGQRRP
jgi:glycosyltransferase involved in cell wall biosynthesis